MKEIIIYIIPNRWIKQAYHQGFDLEIPFKKDKHVFKRMEVAESIEKG